MGIKGLNKIIPSTLTVEKDIKIFSYTKIAIDASFYLYRYKITFKDHFMDAFLEFIVILKEHKIHPVFVFDGTSPPEKDLEKQKRRDDREKQLQRIAMLEEELDKCEDIQSSSILRDAFNKKHKTEDEEFTYEAMADYIEKLKSYIIVLTPEDFTALKELLDIFGIFWIQAPYEAETLCSQLCKQNLVSAVMSADTDLLATNCPVIIKDFTNKKFSCIQMQDVLDHFSFTPEEFKDLCILCGTDFNKNIPKVGPIKSLHLIHTYRSLENIPLDTSILNFKRVRELFDHHTWEEKVPFNKPIKYLKLEEWLNDHNVTLTLDDIRNKLELS